MYKCLIISIVLFLLACSADKKHDGKGNLKLAALLDSLSRSYTSKIDADYREKINFVLQDGSKPYCVTILPDNRYRVSAGLDSNAAFTFQSTLAYFNKIYSGKVSAFTALGRENIKERTPLMVSFSGHIDYADSTMNRFFFFVQRFFNRHAHDKLLLNEKSARIVHGAYAVPIFYRKHGALGVRSAWYQVNKGQQINDPGDVNPFPQYLMFIAGKGKAKLGGDTLSVKQGEAYYVAPGEDHVIWNDSDEPLRLIWVAWGKGA